MRHDEYVRTRYVLYTHEVKIFKRNDFLASPFLTETKQNEMKNLLENNITNAAFIRRES